jgi:hypothetical protein
MICEIKNIGKMKALLTLVLLTSSLVVLAQDFSIEPPSKDTAKDQKRVKNADSPNPWSGLYIGPVASVNRSVIFNSGSGTIANGIGFDGGGEISDMVFPHIGFSTGLRFQQYSFNFSYTNINGTTSYNGTTTALRSGSSDTTVTAGYNSSANYTFDYLRIPLLARYISGGNDKVGFYVEMGFVADILLSANVSGSATQTQYELSQPPNTSWYNYNSTLTPANTNISETGLDASRFNISFRAGLGVLIPIKENMYLVLDYGIDYRILNGGTGKNDVVSFGNNQYYFYGNSNYGSFNFQSLEAKLIFKLNN